MQLCRVLTLSFLLLFGPTIAFATQSARDVDGLTELHRAARSGNIKKLRDLLDQGQSLFELDSKLGVSVLHKAVYSRNPEAVGLLLKRGALTDLQSPSNGNTALHDALYFKNGS